MLSRNPLYVVRKAADGPRRWLGGQWARLDKALWGRGKTVVISGLAAIAFVGAVGLAVGIKLEQLTIPARFMGRIHGFTVQFEKPPQTETVNWEDMPTNRHILQVARFRVFNAAIAGGAIAEVGDNILTMSPQGRFGWMDPRRQLHDLHLATRMNLEGLRNDPLYEDPQFNIRNIRSTGMLPVQTGPNAWDLYVIYNRYAGGCFDLVLSKTTITSTGDVMTAPSGWTDVWKATPCVPLKNRGSRFEGFAGGGRLVRNGPDTFFISIGDYQLDGSYDSRQLSDKRDNDFSKILEFNMKTGKARHYAFGVRNPEGLTIDDQGRIWETEHGPQGGDELNLIKEGQDYGWPFVTYGMQYGSPPMDWPFNPKPGQHEGYVRPRFAWVPSIGVSDVIMADPREFPRWKGSLLVESLAAGTLHILKLEGEDVVFDEPVVFNRRLRDITFLKDGTLAILCDGGDLMLIRNSELHKADSQPFVVGGFQQLGTPTLEETPPSTGMTAETHGRMLFQSACSSCHSLGDEPGAGPSLRGVYGRQIATGPGFTYSASLSARKESWNDSLLASFIENPQSIAKDTRMPYVGLPSDMIPDIVTYLKTVH